MMTCPDKTIRFTTAIHQNRTEQQTGWKDAGRCSIPVFLVHANRARRAQDTAGWMREGWRLHAWHCTAQLMFVGTDMLMVEVLRILPPTGII